LKNKPLMKKILSVLVLLPFVLGAQAQAGKIDEAGLAKLKEYEDT
jgi:outer membrane lipoprotein-sorting protein